MFGFVDLPWGISLSWLIVPVVLIALAFIANSAAGTFLADIGKKLFGPTARVIGRHKIFTGVVTGLLVVAGCAGIWMFVVNPTKDYMVNISEQHDYNQYSESINASIKSSCASHIKLYENSDVMYKALAEPSNKNGIEGFAVVVKKVGSYSPFPEMKFSFQKIDGNWLLETKADVGDTSYSSKLKKVLATLQKNDCADQMIAKEAQVEKKQAPQQEVSISDANVSEEMKSPDIAADGLKEKVLGLAESLWPFGKSEESK